MKTESRDDERVAVVRAEQVYACSVDGTSRNAEIRPKAAQRPGNSTISQDLFDSNIRYLLFLARITFPLYNFNMDTLLLQSPSQLSLHLKSLRKSRNVTQADMARRLGVTQERYSQMEGRPQIISVERLLEILAILQVDVLLKVRARSAERAASPVSPRKPARRGEDW